MVLPSLEQIGSMNEIIHILR
ncbi:unnamed protein product [Nezara viridula]|uniref:Uncharacterized protein n=1 Tax=Nezara viridula TaxID=85310 RepID=A0A9P0HBI1_NEZVI|nr:unnamed protein product [Nezara viridula]